MQYFGEPEGRVKIQMMSKNLQRYYTKMSNKRFIIQRFRFLKILTLRRFLRVRAVGGMRRVQISCDYLYSFRALFVLYEAVLDNNTP